jgi:PTS system nitrogen regulatory IIA component
MDIITLLSPDRIVCNQTLNSKKRAFEMLAQLLATAQSQVTHSEVFDALINREKLGCTALGNGIAIPHARLAISRPRAAILSLKEGIALDAPDKKPVTFLIGILLPKETSSQDTKILQELTTIPYKKGFIENLCHYQEPTIVIDYFNTFYDKTPIAA